MIRLEDICYLAGLLDGEGCITVFPRTDSRSTRLSVSIAMTDAGVVNWVKQTFGGRFYQKSQAKNGWKAAWTWMVSDKEAGAILELVLPYLKVKYIQAKLGIELAVLKTQGRPKNPADYLRQLEISEQFRELNRKGVAA